VLTCIISGPKRSGTTLLNRLFDSQPGMIDLNDEAFFWEHAYRYAAAGRSEIFLDLFRMYSPDALTEGFIERDLLPWIEGRYQQSASFLEFEMDLAFSSDTFTSGLTALSMCETVEEVWHTLVEAYAAAAERDYSEADKVLIKSADYGMSVLGGRQFLKRTKSVFILRNPYYALDSLKKSRQIRGSKILNPFNFGEALRDYAFFGDHQDEILSNGTLLVLYEDLIANPQGIMKQIASHFRVPFTENLLNPTLSGKPWPGLSSFQATKGIDVSILDRPLQTLMNEEIDLVGKHLKGLLEAYGYTHTSQSPSRRTRCES